MRTPVPVLVPRTDWDAHFHTRHAAFAPIAPAAARFAQHPAWPPVDAWNDALADVSITVEHGARVRFVEQPPKRRTKAPLDPMSLYEVRIHERAEVPSRPRNWHDLLNMLCWATFPRAKAALNARQFRAITAWLPPGATQIPGARTREQDALAMLDEGGCLVPCLPDAHATVLRCIATSDHDALASLVAARRARVLVFGHAAYEHLVAGHATVRAMPVTLPLASLPDATDALVTACDTALAATLADPRSLTAPCDDPALPMGDALLAAHHRTEPRS